MEKVSLFDGKWSGGVQISAGVQSERYGHINLALAKNHYFTDTFSCRATLIAVAICYLISILPGVKTVIDIIINCSH